MLHRQAPWPKATLGCAQTHLTSPRGCRWQRWAGYLVRLKFGQSGYDTRNRVHPEGFRWSLDNEEIGTQHYMVYLFDLSNPLFALAVKIILKKYKDKYGGKGFLCGVNHNHQKAMSGGTGTGRCLLSHQCARPRAAGNGHKGSAAMPFAEEDSHGSKRTHGD